MKENYGIKRSKEIHPDYVRFADEYIFKASRVYPKSWFTSKKKRLSLVKEHAINQLLDVQFNLCNSSWVCLSKSEKKINIVKNFIHDSIDTIYYITSI